MPKFLTSNFFWLFYTAGLVSFASTLFFGWVLMVGTLFLIFWIFRLTGWEAQLHDRAHQLYLLAMLLYTPLETAVQWMVVNGRIPGDFTWVNRLEHACWAMMLTLLFLPLMVPIWHKLNRWQSLLFVLGFTCLLGNLNEFFEYVVRIQETPIKQALFAHFYGDTIYDMIMNLCGSFAGFLALNWVEQGSVEARSES